MKTQYILFSCSENPTYSYIASLLLNKLGNNKFSGFCNEIQSDSLSIETEKALDFVNLDHSPQSFDPSTKADDDYDYTIHLCDKSTSVCEVSSDKSQQLCWHIDVDKNNSFKAIPNVLQELNNRIRMFVLVKTKRDAT